MAVLYKDCRNSFDNFTSPFFNFLSTPKAVDLQMRKNIINLEKCKVR